jgi:hypothetical protein
MSAYWSASLSEKGCRLTEESEIHSIPGEHFYLDDDYKKSECSRQDGAI